MLITIIPYLPLLFNFAFHVNKFMTGAWSKQKGVFEYYACRRPKYKKRYKIKKADAEI